MIENFESLAYSRLPYCRELISRHFFSTAGAADGIGRVNLWAQFDSGHNLFSWEAVSDHSSNLKFAAVGQNSVPHFSVSFERVLRWTQ